MKPALLFLGILLLCACGLATQTSGPVPSTPTRRVETTMVPSTPATTPTYWVETTIGAPQPTSTPPYYATLGVTALF